VRTHPRGRHEKVSSVQQHPTPIHTPAGLRRVGLDPVPELHPFFHAGWWQAAYPTCGHVLAEGRQRDKVDRRAAATCPVCVEIA
jgi:hypothetical protein